MTADNYYLNCQSDLAEEVARIVGVVPPIISNIDDIVKMDVYQMCVYLKGKALDELISDPVSYGTVLRAKGIVPCDDGTWIHFDYVPGAPDVRRGAAGFTGRLCVIGSNLKEEPLNELFHL